jgi:ABC-type transport system involved in multi-copper enzyme maturation permease subunit
MIMRLELFRLRSRPGRVLLVIAALTALKALLLLAVKAGAFGNVQNGFAYLAISAGYTLFLVSVLLCVAAAASLSGEYASGLLRMYLARPVSRSAYFLNRALYLLALTFLVLALDGTAGALLGWAGFGFHDVADPKLHGDAFSASAMAAACVKSYLLAYLGLAGITALGLLISVLVRTPSVAVSTATALFFLMEGLRLIFREQAPLVVTHYARSPMLRLSELARRIAGYQPPDHLFKSLCIPLGYVVLVLVLGLLIFRNRDVLD